MPDQGGYDRNFRRQRVRLRKGEQKELDESLKTPRERMLELLRAGGAADFWFLATRILRLDLVPHVHGDVADAMQNYAMYAGTRLREILLVMARGHFKSTLVAAYIAWRIIRDRNVRCMIVAANEGDAQKTVRQVMAFLEDPLVVALYGSFRGKGHWSEEELIVSGRSAALRDPTLCARGRNNFRPGPHVEILVFDDFEDSFTTTTPEMLAKGRDLDAQAVPMTDQPDSLRLTLGTYWDDNDILCHKEEKYELLDTVKLPDGRTIHTRKNGVVKNGVAYFYKPLVSEDGEPIFPERFPKERIEQIRFDMRLNPSMFAKQYLLDPVHRDTAAFREEDMRVVGVNPLDTFWTYVAFDLANTVGQDSARTGIVEFAVGPHMHVHVLRARGLKMDGSAQMEEIFRLKAIHERPTFCFEEENYYRGWVIGFDALQRERKSFIRRLSVNAHGRKSKDERILGLQGLLRQGNVTFSDECGDLIHELLRFPQGRYRDVADAFASGIELATSPREAKLRRPEERNVPVSDVVRTMKDRLHTRSKSQKLTTDPKEALSW